MSRSGYSDDLDTLDLGRWRGRVASTIRGKRGQKLLCDMLAALDAMPERSLAAQSLVTADGEVCALGCVAKARGIQMPIIDLEDVSQKDTEAIAVDLDISDVLAKEIAYENDEGGWGENGGQRWTRMRAWVAAQIKEPKP